MAKLKRTVFIIIVLLIVSGGVFIYNQEKKVPIALLTCTESEIPNNLPNLTSLAIKYTYKENENGSFTIYVLESLKFNK